MDCPYCQSFARTERPEYTELGHRRFRWGTYQLGFIRWTGTLFNRLHYPPHVVCLVARRRFRYATHSPQRTEDRY